MNTLSTHWKVWDLTRIADTLIKDELLYTIMIRQPDFVTQEIRPGT